MFFLVLLFLLGGNFGHILFYLVAFIQWNDLRGQTIPAFLMKGCFVDSIDIDGFNWIRITDQITQHKSSNDKKRKRLVNARESGKEEIELKNGTLFELVLY